MLIRDVTLAVLVAFLWGLNFVVIDIGLGEFPPIFFSALRFTLAAFPLVLFLKKPNVAWKYILGIGLVLGVVKFTLLFEGMDVGLSAGLASLVLQSQAFFTVILAALIFRERPTAFQIIGIAVAFSGIWLVMTTIEGNAALFGLILVICAGVAWAVSNLLIKRVGAVDMLSLMVWVSLVPPIPLLLLSFYFEGAQTDLDAIRGLQFKGIGAVLYVSYVATILGFAIWGKLIQRYETSRVVPFSLLVPIFGMASSAVFNGEEFSQLRLLAACLVIAGLVLTTLGNRGVVPAGAE